MTKKKAKRKKLPDLKTLRNKLDVLFSKWVRLSAADSDGFVHCVSCGLSYHWTEVDAGHFIERGSAATRFDPRNVHPECKRCNGLSADHLVGYGLWMEATYGREVIQELWHLKHVPTKIGRIQFNEMIDHYAGLLARLAIDMQGGAPRQDLG